MNYFQYREQIFQKISVLNSKSHVVLLSKRRKAQIMDVRKLTLFVLVILLMGPRFAESTISKYQWLLAEEWEKPEGEAETFNVMYNPEEMYNPTKSDGLLEIHEKSETAKDSDVLELRYDRFGRKSFIPYGKSETVAANPKGTRDEMSGEYETKSMRTLSVPPKVGRAEVGSNSQDNKWRIPSEKMISRDENPTLSVGTTPGETSQSTDPSTSTAITSPHETSLPPSFLEPKGEGEEEEEVTEAEGETEEDEEEEEEVVYGSEWKISPNLVLWILVFAAPTASTGVAILLDILLVIIIDCLSKKGVDEVGMSRQKYEF